MFKNTDYFKLVRATFENGKAVSYEFVDHRSFHEAINPQITDQKELDWSIIQIDSRYHKTSEQIINHINETIDKHFSVMN